VGGGLLLLAAVLGVVAANSGAAEAYESLQEHVIGPAALNLDLSVQTWASDGLLAIFFFIAGLELKRELVVGSLRTPSAAALPIVAAFGGMLVPAGLYLALTAGAPGASEGWAIPMATDIAFALAVLAIVGSKAPKELKLFLLTLAIVDDIGAIIVIALFYGDGIDPAWLLGGAATVVAVVIMQRVPVVRPAWYLVPGVILWVCAFESGVHATIAGVVLGLLTPTGPVGGREVLTGMEDRLHPWSSFVVVPVFALANAGVVIDRASVEAAFSGAVAWGVVLGLLVGKPVGIMTGAAIAVRLKVGALPEGVLLRHLAGISLIAGIGFTVSLFVADLAFEGALLGEAKVAILTASVLAAVGGSLLVRATVPESWD